MHIDILRESILATWAKSYVAYQLASIAKHLREQSDFKFAKGKDSQYELYSNT